MRSLEQVQRPFTVLDAMILTAATAAGLASYSSANFRPENFVQNAESTETYVYYLANYGIRSAHAFLRAWGEGLTHQISQEFGPVHSRDSRSSSPRPGDEWRYSCPCWSSPP